VQLLSSLYSLLTIRDVSYLDLLVKSAISSALCFSHTGMATNVLQHYLTSASNQVAFGVHNSKNMTTPRRISQVLLVKEALEKAISEMLNSDDFEGIEDEIEALGRRIANRLLEFVREISGLYLMFPLYKQTSILGPSTEEVCRAECRVSSATCRETKTALRYTLSEGTTHRNSSTSTASTGAMHC